MPSNGMTRLTYIISSIIRTFNFAKAFYIFTDIDSIKSTGSLESFVFDLFYLWEKILSE